MSFNAGVELPYLSDNERDAVAMATVEIRKFPTLTQAKKIRELSLGADGVSTDSVAEILMDNVKNVDNDEVNFERADIRQFFPMTVYGSPDRGGSCGDFEGMESRKLKIHLKNLKIYLKPVEL